MKLTNTIEKLEKKIGETFSFLLERTKNIENIDLEYSRCKDIKSLKLLAEDLGSGVAFAPSPINDARSIAMGIAIAETILEGKYLWDFQENSLYPSQWEDLSFLWTWGEMSIEAREEIEYFFECVRISCWNRIRGVYDWKEESGRGRGKFFLDYNPEEQNINFQNIEGQPLPSTKIMEIFQSLPLHRRERKHPAVIKTREGFNGNGFTQYIVWAEKLTDVAWYRKKKCVFHTSMYGKFNINLNLWEEDLAFFLEKEEKKEEEKEGKYLLSRYDENLFTSEQDALKAENI